MDKNNKNDPLDEKNKKTENNVKRTKPKNKNTTSNNTEIKRSLFGSRRKKKDKTTDSSSNNDHECHDQNVTRKNINPTEPDAALGNPPTNENEGSGEAPKGALMVTDPHAEEYNMNHPRRGKAVIFNHETFKDDDRREGTKFDVEKITQVFEELLGFEIEVHNDLSYTDIVNEITKLSKDDYTNCDCIAIFVLTHGRKGGEISAKDIYYPIDILWESFRGDKCVTLAGKPKLFFISACRGQKKDKGFRFYLGGRTQADSSNKQVSYKIPNEADFLIARSTVEGYISYRETHSGTWFIQCLCNVISQYYETKDLMKMLTITSRKVAIDYRTVADNPEDSNQTQVPSITTMLIRDVHFYKKA